MKCEHIRERMPDLAAGLAEKTAEISEHLAICPACAGKLQEFRQTMALLDEWRAPEPSPYFDVRLQARLREEMGRPQASWLAWLRRPALATSLTVLLAVGIGLFYADHGGLYAPGTAERVADMQVQTPEPATGVSDLQALDQNHDLYSDFELLDDLEVQQNVVANP